MTNAVSKEEISLLLVEDNPADVELLREVLGERDAAFSLTRAERIETAWRHLQERAFDVVLLDLSLPDGDGRALIDRIARDRVDVAVVVLTGRDDADLAVEIVRTGAQDYIVKSELEANAVWRVLRHARERHRLQRELAKVQEQLLGAERLRVLAETTGAAAHEINQPLTGIMGAVEMLLLADDLSDAHRAKMQSVLGLVERVSEIVRQMQKARRYVTKSYIQDLHIVDFEAAAQSD